MRPGGKRLRGENAQIPARQPPPPRRRHPLPPPAPRRHLRLRHTALLSITESERSAAHATQVTAERRGSVCIQHQVRSQLRGVSVCIDFGSLSQLTESSRRLDSGSLARSRYHPVRESCSAGSRAGGLQRRARSQVMDGSKWLLRRAPDDFADFYYRLEREPSTQHYYGRTLHGHGPSAPHTQSHAHTSHDS